eukprot:TRINITY_DN8498_c0_g1_i1.p1 TRINITY_DN8498_c0_g1~~TRINITY_DN8498_c0_g1_i1.p1  ORF type:complete len:138 (-),score=29.90 TRINITY_DN8498_c0_g1_i1:3-416(-)
MKRYNVGEGDKMSESEVKWMDAYLNDKNTSRVIIEQSEMSIEEEESSKVSSITRKKDEGSSLKLPKRSPNPTFKQLSDMEPTDRAGLIEEILHLKNQRQQDQDTIRPVSYTHLRAHETPEHLVCRLLLEKKKKKQTK